MTTHRNKRCGHCGLHYVYQGSGDGCQRAENDATFCPDCAVIRNTAIREALAKVPRMYEGRWQDIKELGDRFKDVTLEKLKTWEAQDEVVKQASNSLFGSIRRVFTPLIDVKTGDSTVTREIRGRSENPNILTKDRPDYIGVTFRLTTWRQRPDYEVVVEMEWDLREGRYTGQTWR